MKVSRQLAVAMGVWMVVISFILLALINKQVTQSVQLQEQTAKIETLQAHISLLETPSVLTQKPPASPVIKGRIHNGGRLLTSVNPLDECGNLPAGIWCVPTQNFGPQVVPPIQNFRPQVVPPKTSPAPVPYDPLLRCTVYGDGSAGRFIYDCPDELSVI